MADLLLLWRNEEYPYRENKMVKETANNVEPFLYQTG